MIKIRVLVSSSVCGVENGFVCHEADSGWLQEVGLVDRGSSMTDLKHIRTI